MTDETGLADRIRQRAFEIWKQEGQPEGREGEHWERAKREVMGENAPPLQPQATDEHLMDQGEGQTPGEGHG